MQSEKPYVAAFIRRLMPKASEEEIVEASENLRAYLNALYDIFLAREAEAPPADSLDRGRHGRFADTGDTPPQI